MASSEVDQKFLGKLAKKVENDNPLLGSVLFKILGLSINLSEQLVRARKQRRAESTADAQTLELCFHIIWLSREGLVLLEQYVLPMVGNQVELKVLAYKLRASFYHIFVLFHNTPPVSSMAFGTPEGKTTGTMPPLPVARPDKGKGIAKDADLESVSSSIQPTHHLEGGPVGPPPGLRTGAADRLPSEAGRLLAAGTPVFPRSRSARGAAVMGLPFASPLCQDGVHRIPIRMPPGRGWQPEDGQGHHIRGLRGHGRD